MPALHIRDVPDDTVSALKRRAALHGRSVQAELREILERAAAESVPAKLPRGISLLTVATGRTGAFDRAGFYGDDER